MIDNFEKSVALVLSKYKDSPLSARWGEAISFGQGAKASASWIRDSNEVVNIVWLNADGIRDITWHLPSGESMFNFVLLKNIQTFVIRGKKDIAQLGFGIQGDFIVHVVLGGTKSDIWWIAENEDSVKRLELFLKSVLGSYIKAKKRCFLF